MGERKTECRKRKGRRDEKGKERLEREGKGKRKAVVMIIQERRERGRERGD